MGLERNQFGGRGVMMAFDNNGAHARLGSLLRGFYRINAPGKQ
jgi:hypothetical protein